jgi:hypothetical protein
MLLVLFLPVHCSATSILFVLVRWLQLLFYLNFCSGCNFDYIDQCARYNKVFFYLCAGYCFNSIFSTALDATLMLFLSVRWLQLGFSFYQCVGCKFYFIFSSALIATFIFYAIALDTTLTLFLPVR